MVSLTDLIIFSVMHFPSVGKNNYGARIAPDRVSSGPTRFTRSVAMNFMPGHAPIDPIEANHDHFDAQSKIFFEIGEAFRSILLDDEDN